MQVYASLPREERAQYIQRKYDGCDGTQPYSTSRDSNLRELEIAFIRRHLITGEVLDLGCGNGYTLLSLAKDFECRFLGLDFSANMIDSARRLTEKSKKQLKSIPDFRVCDVRRLPFEASSFDCAISERCLLNLPSREDQYQTIREVHRVLKRGGVYLMVEGTEDGLCRLNKIREELGLPPIPSTSSSNPTSLKFKEADIQAFLRPLFEIEVTQFFGMYYLISRSCIRFLCIPRILVSMRRSIRLHV